MFGQCLLDSVSDLNLQKCRWGEDHDPDRYAKAHQSDLDLPELCPFLLHAVFQLAEIYDTSLLQGKTSLIPVY